jgi:hypothetical protein
MIVVILIWFEICLVVFDGILLLGSGNGRPACHAWPCHWKFLGSTSPLCRTLSTMQNPIPQIIHQTSPATEQIWALCSMGVGSQKASISLNSQYGSSCIEKSRRRPWNHCVKNSSCWRSYWCSHSLENSPWTITLPVPHPAGASPHSFWPLCNCGVLPMAARKVHCKHTVCS